MDGDPVPEPSDIQVLQIDQGIFFTIGEKKPSCQIIFSLMVLREKNLFAFHKKCLQCLATR